MRLTVILLTAFCVQVSARSWSQEITFSGKNVSLEKILQEVKKQTGFLAVYNESLLTVSNPINISCTNMPLNEFMAEVLKDQSIQFSIRENTIILEKKIEKENKKSIINELVTSPPINGIVRGPDGKPLAGVNVVVKGTTRGAVTDVYGGFSIEAEIGNTLVISSVGFLSRDIKIDQANAIVNIQLHINNSSLDEVQIIAYGTTSQRVSTGNVVTVNNKEIALQPVSNPLAALQGRVPGMVITQNTGVPGGSYNIEIRGTNSIENGITPLYIVDGVPYPTQLLPNNGLNILKGSTRGGVSSGNPLSYLNPNDIETISILKDADATAIYGSRGANGVVLITTKKGTKGQQRIQIGATKRNRTCGFKT